MAENKNNSKNERTEDELRDETKRNGNQNQAGEPSEEIESHEIGAENMNLSDEEVERQEQWRDNPDSREYFGPKVVPADDMNPKN